MKKVYQVLVFLFILSVTCSLNPELYAAEGLKIGDSDVEIVPWGEITLQYDDNVFLSHENKKDDIALTLTPGISLLAPFQDNLLKLDYYVNINKYLDNSSQDANNHHLSADLLLKMRDVTFNIYDKFDHVFERPSTEDTNRVKRDDNRAGATAKLQMNRLGIQLGYENFIRDYKSDTVYDAYDRTEDIYSLVLTHKTFPKTELLLEYDYGTIDYDQSALSNSNYHQLLVGAIGNLTPKTTASVKTGYQIRAYEGSDDPDYNAWVLYSDIIHSFSDKNAIKISVSRQPHESTYGINNYYKAENVTAIFDHFFTVKLMGFLTGEYQINSYPRETTEDSETLNRKDTYYSAGAGFKYDLQKWLALTLKFEHIIRDSNFTTFDYDQNLVTFTAKAIF
jgi:hypothetical protein